jgi:hypothetical protein
MTSLFKTPSQPGKNMSDMYQQAEAEIKPKGAGNWSFRKSLGLMSGFCF